MFFKLENTQFNCFFFLLKNKKPLLHRVNLVRQRNIYPLALKSMSSIV